MAKQYPECPPLGSDSAELTAFALTLRLIARLEREGHSPACARMMVSDDAPCICPKVKP